MDAMVDSITDFLACTIKKIVDDVTKVKVIPVVTTSNHVIFQISVAKEDRGKVIGKSGKTIEAIKTLTMAVKNTLSDDRRKISIEILEDDE